MRLGERETADAERSNTEEVLALQTQLNQRSVEHELDGAPVKSMADEATTRDERCPGSQPNKNQRLGSTRRQRVEESVKRRVALLADAGESVCTLGTAAIVDDVDMVRTPKIMKRRAKDDTPEKIESGGRGPRSSLTNRHGRGDWAEAQTTRRS